MIILYLVFVPGGGIDFKNISMFFLLYSPKFVFVPGGGIDFKNEFNKKIYSNTDTFSSPVGELILKTRPLLYKYTVNFI